jgi:hypothetical protein
MQQQIQHCGSIYVAPVPTLQTKLLPARLFISSGFHGCLSAAARLCSRCGAPVSATGLRFKCARFGVCVLSIRFYANA